MTNYTTPVLTFRAAYARKDTTKTDQLKIYVSINCGQNWTIRKTYSGTQLATTANVTGSFTPSSTAQWGLFTLSGITMNPIANKPNVRIKFELNSGGDNNLYMDDINLIATPTGIDEAKIMALNFDVFPNPSNDQFNISFEMPASEKAEIKITDMIGREIKTVVNERLVAGSHQYTLNTHEFSKGIYLVSLKAGEMLSVKKLVVE
jgi:hypothetical protein